MEMLLGSFHGPAIRRDARTRININQRSEDSAMKFSSKVKKCGLSPMRKFHPYAVAAEPPARKSTT